MKNETERMPNGTVVPGKDTIITTTIGHRFAVVGHDDKSETIIASEVPVQAFRVGGVPSFYAQRVEAHGFPIVGSARVNPSALKEAAYLVDLMLANRPDVREAMITSGSRMCVLAWNEFTTDQPEFARLGAEKMRDFPGVSGKDYWDARARGLGGSGTDPFCSCAEENLLGYPGDPYAAECILIHEFAHNIHLRGMNNVDPTFDARLKKAYDEAVKAGLWKGKYAGTNHHEYFAEGVQSWFDNNRSNDHDHNHVHLRSQLIEYDPGLAAMCREVFGDTELKYTKPATRLTAHMAGYDPAKAPTFVWPARLAAAREQIKKAARTRDKNANGKKTAIEREVCEVSGWKVHINTVLLDSQRALLESNPRTPPVGVEAFDAAELLDGGDAFRQRGAVEADDARAALEHVGHEAGETFSRAARGQRVARPGDEIARGHGRPAAEENRAARADVARDGVLVFGDDGDVLGREVVGDGNAVGEGLHEDERGVLPEDFGEIRAAAERGGLGADLPFHGGEEARAVGDEQDAAAVAVLGLREEVGGDPRGICGGVGEDEDFARAGEEVDGALAEDLALRLDDPRAAGAEDFLHGPDGLRAIRERRDGLRAADTVNLGRAAIEQRVVQ
jgi:hypothetical protein